MKYDTQKISQDFDDHSDTPTLEGLTEKQKAALVEPVFGAKATDGITLVLVVTWTRARGQEASVFMTSERDGRSFNNMDQTVDSHKAFTRVNRFMTAEMDDQFFDFMDGLECPLVGPE